MCKKVKHGKNWGGRTKHKRRRGVKKRRALVRSEYVKKSRPPKDRRPRRVSSRVVERRQGEGGKRCRSKSEMGQTGPRFIGGAPIAYCIGLIDQGVKKRRRFRSSYNTKCEYSGGGKLSGGFDWKANIGLEKKKGKALRKKNVIVSRGRISIECLLYRLAGAG